MKKGMVKCSACRSNFVSTTETILSSDDQHRSTKSSKPLALSVLLVVGDCILVGLQPVLIFMSKVDGKFKFNPLSVNFLTEATRFLFAIAILLLQSRYQKVGEKPLLSASTFIQLYFNPATVKMLSNLKNAVWWILCYPVCTFNRAYTCSLFSKFPVIAVLLKVIMRRRFSVIQLEALALLLIGVGINQLQSHPEGTTTFGLPVTAIAYIYTLISVIVPSLASVYHEYALKSQYYTNVYLQNLCLYGYGAIFNFLAILGMAIFKGPSNFDILHGQSKETMLLIFISAAHGNLSSFFYKYADTILKKYSAIIATLFTGIASALLFGQTLTINVILLCSSQCTWLVME